MKHLNLIALGGIVIILSVLFGIATIRITGKYRFKLSAEEMLEKVTVEAQKLDLNEVAELKSNDNVVFIDIRTPKEFVGIHIQNAANIPFDRLLDDEFEGLFNNDQKKILYGNTSVGANAAWMILTQYGYENLIVLDGDAEAWIAQVERKDIFKDAYKSDEVALFRYEEVMKADIE